MEPAEIAAIVKEFEAKLKPITPMMKAAAGIEVVPPVPEVAKPPAPCVKKGFQDMVGALSPDFIGGDGVDIKDLVVAFLQSLPQCG